MKTVPILPLACVLLLLLPCCAGIAALTPTNDSRPKRADIEGQILFAPMDSLTTYLIDRSGAVNHTWTSKYRPGLGVRWLGNGTILRTIDLGTPGYGGTGGGVQKILPDGTIAWDFRYDYGGNITHHDVQVLPNGNVLLVAWEKKTRAEAIAAGRDPSSFDSQNFYPSHIIEVQPTGPITGTIVWEWHVWDHLIQDFDASKENYGVVGDHPELVDLNFGDNKGGDWLHTNSLDYNAEFDQILISAHNFNEIWVIDHSTTTEEAAGHTGGHSGHGGDLLYRWGNPQAYRAGTENDQVFSCQHDATWIRPGCPGAGDILVFNNGVIRHYSSVDEITPPVNDQGDYYLDPGQAYGPQTLTWTYQGSPPLSFYASHLSGAERLPDGDTLISNGETGYFFEVTPDKTVVWHYTNPYPSSGSNQVFKIVYVAPPAPPESPQPDLDGSGSLHWTDIQPGATVFGSFTVQNIGDSDSLLNWTVNTSELTWGTWTFTPASGNDLTPQAGSVTVQVSVVAPDEENANFAGSIRIENIENASDYDLIPVSLSTPALLQAMVQTAMPSQLPGVHTQVISLRRSI